MADEEAWMRAVTAALNEESAEAETAKPKLDDAQRAAIVRAALAARTPRPRLRFVRWAAPAATLALAASLLLFLRRPDPFVDYGVEVASIESVRGEEHSAAKEIVARAGFPFEVRLRPATTSDHPVRVAETFVRSGTYERPVACAIEVAASGAVRVRGDGALLENAETLVISVSREPGGRDTKRFELPIRHSAP